MEQVDKDKMEVLKVYIDLQWKSMSTSVDLLVKGITFYLAVMAVLTGFITTKGIDAKVYQNIWWLMAIIALFAIVAAISLVLYNQKELNSLQRNCELMDGRAFEEAKFFEMFKRVKIVGWIASICCLLIGLVTLFGLWHILQAGDNVSSVGCVLG